MSDPVIAPTARKHGVTDTDILHAHHHPIRIYDLDDGFTMIIGPATNGTLLEVGVIQGDTADVIVHAMPARPKFLRS